MKEAAYKIMDALTMGKGIKASISGFEVRLPTRYHKYFNPNYEWENIRFLNAILEKGAHVMDVGAHIGLMSAIIAQKIGPAGRLISLEPTPSTFALLEKTIEINGLAEMATPLQRAVSDKKGRATFYITDIVAHNSNSLADNHRTVGNEHGIDVDVTSVDALQAEFAFPKIDFLKIDAEGAELSVLQGAAGAIERHRPDMLLALHPEAIAAFGDSLEAIWEFLKSRRYTVHYRNHEITKEFFTGQTGLFDVFVT